MHKVRNKSLRPVLVLALAAGTVVLPLVGYRCESSGGQDTRGNNALVQAVDGILRDAFPEDEPGAAVIVQHRGEEILRRGYGIADLELAVPFGPDMVSRIGSVTKQVTAVAVMILVENGKVSLDDPVRKFLPRLPEGFSPVRVEHLLSNTSGIPDYMHTEQFNVIIENDYHYIVNEDLDIDKILRIIAESELAFEPGRRYSYSNSNYFLLAMIIEEVSGEAYFDFVRREICEPAGMANTHYIAGAAFVPGRVPVHLEYEGQIIKSPHRCMGSTLGFGAGGLWSTVDDMARYNTALESGDIVTAETLAKMAQPFKLNNGRTSSYGLGWHLANVKGKKMVFHGGDYLGYSALIVRIPPEAIFIAILSNDGRIHAFNLEYPAKKIAAVLFGDPFPEWESIDMTPEQLEKYEGTYRLGENDVREFIVDGGQAYTSRNGRPKLEVYPASASIFFYDVTLGYIEFEFDEAGVPTKMVMHRDTGVDEVAERMK
jgi:CubicO group peptidase (beta-lactamase class C family)